jgi:hypothetical protein
MVWAGLIGNNIVGPFFIDGHVNGEVYLNMLGDLIKPELEILNYDLDEIMYQQDGAPAHNYRDVVDWLKNNIPNWIGTRGPTKWPPCSPDLTPLDFSIWSYIKNRVYQTPPATMEELKERIVHCFETIPLNMFQNIHANVIKRINMCRAVQGGHFEQLL